MRKLTATLCLMIAVTILGGCMTTNFTDKKMDKHSYGADYAYDLTNAELIIYVSKNKYQFFPDASAVIEECKSAVQPIRYSVVKKENIRTEKKPKNGIQVSSGRNGVTGITSCSGKATFIRLSGQETAKIPLPKNPSPKKSLQPKTVSTGSGFFVSKLGHILTNEHVVRKCGSVTVGDNANKQVTASVLETDQRNDLALLRISSTKMASAETKSLISKLNVQKLGLKLVPLASGGLMRSDDIELGEKVLVAGFPYGELYSNTIKVTGGMVSAVKGMGDDSAQFQMDAAVQPGNSGGPIYDENGNIVGVVISQLDKRKVERVIGSLPENVNFGIKASTVRQFLTSAGLPTKWSNRTKRKSTKELAQIAKNQTVMVVCNS